MSNFDKHVLAFFPTHIRFGPIQRLQSIRKIKFHVRIMSMTTSVERTDLDFKISVALSLPAIAPHTEDCHGSTGEP